MMLLSNGEYESQDEQKDVITELDETSECPEVGELLSVMVNPEETEQSEKNIYTCCIIKNKVCNLIIDDGSCTNVASKYMVEKFRTSHH